MGTRRRRRRRKPGPSSCACIAPIASPSRCPLQALRRPAPTLSRAATACLPSRRCGPPPLAASPSLLSSPRMRPPSGMLPLPCTGRCEPVATAGTSREHQNVCHALVRQLALSAAMRDLPRSPFTPPLRHLCLAPPPPPAVAQRFGLSTDAVLKVRGQCQTRLISCDGSALQLRHWRHQRDAFFLQARLAIDKVAVLVRS